jgi:hypothetical protein
MHAQIHLLSCKSSSRLPQKGLHAPFPHSAHPLTARTFHTTIDFCVSFGGLHHTRRRTAVRFQPRWMHRLAHSHRNQYIAPRGSRPPRLSSNLTIKGDLQGQPGGFMRSKFDPEPRRLGMGETALRIAINLKGFGMSRGP